MDKKDKNPDFNPDALKKLTLSDSSGAETDETAREIFAKGESIGRGAFVILIARIFGLACTFITMNIVLPRLMPAGDFGSFQIIMSFVIIFEIAIHYGLPSAISKLVAEDIRFIGFFLTKGFKLQVWFSLILFATTLLLSPIITYYLKEDRTFILFFALAMIDIPAYAMYNIRMSVLNGLRRFTRESYTVLWYNARRTIFTIGAVWWAYREGKIELMIPLALIANIMSSIVGLYFSNVYTKGYGGYREDPNMLKKIIAFIAPNMAGMLIYTTLLKLDLWSVQAFITSGMSTGNITDPKFDPELIIGSYAYSGSLAVIPSLLFHSLYPAIYPSISYHLGHGEFDKVRKLIIQATKANFLILLPFSLAIAGTSKEIIAILVGNKYPFAWVFLDVMVFGATCYTFFLTLCVIMVAINYPYIVFKHLITALIAAFFFTWLFMTHMPENIFGPETPIGWALAGPGVQIIIGITGTAILGLWLHRKFKAFVNIWKIVKIFAATLIASPFIYLLNFKSFWVVIEYLLYFISYSILLYLFGVFEPDEKKKILKLLRIGAKSAKKQ
ncbi:MAG: oligosaccharide flippase family protein [bacterium]|nr:oligosaccharide flippase family protein [bacterium]